MHFDVNDAGFITNPGKFEAEPLYVPYFWDLGLNGFFDNDDNHVFMFNIKDEDKKMFPELEKENIRTIFVWEDDQGFVHCEAKE